MATEVEWDEDDEWVDEDSIPGCGWCAWCHQFILAEDALDTSGWYGDLCVDCGRKAQASLDTIQQPTPRTSWQRILDDDDWA